MIAFIDERKASYGVESISDVIEIAPATYYEHKRQEREPDRRSVRVKRDEALMPEIRRVFDAQDRPALVAVQGEHWITAEPASVVKRLGSNGEF